MSDIVYRDWTPEGLTDVNAERAQEVLARKDAEIIELHTLVGFLSSELDAHERRLGDVERSAAAIRSLLAARAARSADTEGTA